MKWIEAYNLASKYYHYHGNLYISSSFKTQDGITYNENGFPLGSWIHDQRVNHLNGILESERVSKLNNIGMTWILKESKDSVKKLYETYSIDYKLNRKVLQRMPAAEFKIKINYLLGVNESITNSDGIVHPIFNMSLLEASQVYGIDIPKQESLWEKSYHLVKEYQEKHNNILIPIKFITDNTYSIPDYKLGRWISRQRTLYTNNELSQDKIAKLEALGMVWDASKLDWEANFALAKSYYEHYGNLDVPDNFITTNGYEVSEYGTNLSKWLHSQRAANYDNKVSENNIERLNSIGMIWEVQDYTWNKYYDLACNYHHYYGNLNINKAFCTKDGITYDQDGLPLGVWLSNQRTAYKRGLLYLNREYLLNKLGIIWNNKKHLDDISDICLKYHINKELNKDILRRISKIMLIIKINILINNNQYIIDAKGLLNPIFSMSNKDVEKLYNIKISNLMEKEASRIGGIK